METESNSSSESDGESEGEQKAAESWEDVPLDQLQLKIQRIFQDEAAKLGIKTNDQSEKAENGQDSETKSLESHFEKDLPVLLIDTTKVMEEGEKASTSKELRSLTPKSTQRIC